MFDQVLLDKEVNEFIKTGRAAEAERRLLGLYNELKESDNFGQLEYLANRLAELYSMPETEDRSKAEYYFEQCERISSTAHARLQTATFYFYVLRNFQKTIAKVDEIKMLKKTDTSPSYYSALSLKGQSLISLERVDEAGQVLTELLAMIKANPPRFPFGDEMNFLEAAMAHDALAPVSREILQLIVPNIRSQEYVERAKALLSAV